MNMTVKNLYCPLVADGSIGHTTSFFIPSHWSPCIQSLIVKSYTVCSYILCVYSVLFTVCCMIYCVLLSSVIETFPKQQWDVHTCFMQPLTRWHRKQEVNFSKAPFHWFNKYLPSTQTRLKSIRVTTTQRCLFKDNDVIMTSVPPRDDTWLVLVNKL